MSDTNPKTIETIRANANTREQRVQRLAKIAGELLQIGEDTVSEYLARDAEIARLTAALRTETTMKEQLQDQLEERRLAYRAEWERAEGLTAELAGARRAATASIVSVNADRDRLTAELAEARALTHLDPEDENCPRCHQRDCSPACIAAEQAEIDAWTGPTPRKKA